jgi:hypothetical protein
MIVIRARISSTLELDVVGDTTQSSTQLVFDDRVIPERWMNEVP